MQNYEFDCNNCFRDPLGPPGEPRAARASKAVWCLALVSFRLLKAPQTMLALRGSYGVAFREGPWTRSQCGDAAGLHFPSFSSYKIHVTLKSSQVLQEINVRRRCRPAYFFHFYNTKSMSFSKTFLFFKQ